MRKAGLWDNAEVEVWLVNWQAVSQRVVLFHDDPPQGRGASEQGFDDLMADLEYDWYLRLDPDTNEFYFRLKIMQDWWRRWYPPSAAETKAPNGKTSHTENS